VTSRWLTPNSGVRLLFVASLLVLLPIVISVSLFFAARSYTDGARGDACARVAVIRNVVNREASDRRQLAQINGEHSHAVGKLSRRTPDPTFRDYLLSEALVRQKTAAVLAGEARYIQAQIRVVPC
jgi:hypothetical protein